MDFNKPLSRDEAILQNILGAQNVLSDPQSEIEAILQAILNDTPYTEEARSRIASLLIAIKNKGVPLPDNAYLLKDIANTPASIATFTDGANLPMPSLKVGIEPQQDLHGYDSPWVGGSGKNKLQVTATTQTINGVTFTVNSDGTVNLSGTATGTFVFPLISGTLSFSSDTIITGGYAEASASKVALRINGSNLVPSEGYTISANTNITEIAIRVNSGFNTNGVKLYPMIRLSTESDDTFAPYSNICPISGWDEVNVVDAGINLWDEEYESGYIDAGGVFHSHDNSLASKNYIAVEPNIQLWLVTNTYNSLVIFFYDENKQFISYIVKSNNTTFTTPDNTYFIKFGNTYNGGKTYNNDISINCPSTDTNYHAYNGRTYTIQFKDGSNPLTVYGGTLDVVSGVLTVDRIKWVITPTASQISSADTSKCIIMLNTEQIPNSYNVTVNKGISNKLKVTNYSEQRDDHIHFPNTSMIALYLSNEVGTTKQAWIDYLAQEQIEISYLVATPQTYQLNPTAVKSLLGSNNVWGDTGKIEELEYFSKEGY